MGAEKSPSFRDTVRDVKQASKNSDTNSDQQPGLRQDDRGFARNVGE